MPAGPSRDELREHLIRTGIAGAVATPREDNLEKYRSLAERDPYHLFGLTIAERWDFRQILALMSKAVGVNADPGYTEGPDTIDPDRTIDAVEAMADRIAAALRAPRPRLLLATGHPTGLLTVHLAIARFARAHGAVLLHPAEGWRHRTGRGHGAQVIRYLDGVAMLAERGAFVHTHEAAPMAAMLAELGAERPDLVIADHGWAGAAGEAGLPVVGFADCNDPALFVGEADGKIDVVVPLDDNVSPRYYGPLTAYLLARAGRDL